MNPELQRNLWLEASPSRLLLIAGLLLLVFAAASVAPRALVTPSGAALGLYWFFAVLWGTRSAALSVVAEIRERTWDMQRLSAIGPWEMVWGKLFGATAANWFGALLCLPLILLHAADQHEWLSALTYGAVLVTLGIFAQAVALLSSLVLIRRNTGNWRLDAFLCQVAGIGAAMTYYSLWNSISAFERSGTSTLIWWGHTFTLSGFHLASLLVFLGWALVGCWRTMRAELRFANGPFVWLAYLAYSAIYAAGFEYWIGTRAYMSVNAEHASGKLALAGITLLASTYGMAFLEPKDPVRLRWLGEQIRDRHIYQAFMALDCWMLSYAATIVVGLVLALSWQANGALTVLAMLGFLTRDVAIFVLMQGRAGGKGDFAALGILGALYLLVPTLMAGLDLRTLNFLVQPIGALSVVAAWAEGAVCAYLAFKRIAG